ncbi:MAG: hypothetical protein Ct9H90mP2_01520 [Dehalococcoidia bacterium]|nr:MAG: hypothetical protein Ct9H90mP2_01520 [Dehalococcoidia bacterium]
MILELEKETSIDYLLEQNTKVIIVSHMGRPKGKYSRNYHLKIY